MDIFIHPDFYTYYKNCPIRLVDVGASGGISKKWEPALQFLEYIGFEPDEDAYMKLSNALPSNIKYLKTGLWKEKTTVDFHITRKQKCSSILKLNRDFLDCFPDSQRFDVIKTEQIKVDTLDNQLSIHNIKDIDFIKVDTQGSELCILQGAEKSIQNVIGIETEVEFNEIYQDQPLFSDIDFYLRDKGFQLFDLKKTYWKRVGSKRYDCKGQIICGDALYLKTLSCFYDNLNSLDDIAKKTKVLKAISIYVLFSYIDYAEALFKKTKHYFSDLQVQLINNFFTQTTQPIKQLPAFPGKRTLTKLCLSGYHLLKTPKKQWWVFSDKDLVK